MKPTIPGPTALRECAPLQAPVVVVGGGMAGSWVAYQLVKAGVGTVLLTYGEADRGGVQGSSRRSAGAINLAPLSETALETYLQEMGRGQTHPAVAPTLRTYFPRALEELRAMIGLKPIKLGYALGAGGGEELMRTLQGRFCELGGRIVNGWVTRLVASAERCQGLQYESSEGVGKIRCHTLVLAAGGYAGLFKNAIRTNCFGNVLGAYLERGGMATNLEFLFKHGYGNVDANALTPTEELPGSEIYDGDHARVGWLEKTLFQRQGTNTHLQAVQHWLRNPDNEYYLDLSYRSLYLSLWNLNGAVGDLKSGAGCSVANGRAMAVGASALEEVVALFPERSRQAARQRIEAWMGEGVELEYSLFEELKPLMELRSFTKFRVRPLTYFSMGGIGHRDFVTNLWNTYVTGEAMHDFGANRVGGLPWSLYLASGCSVAGRIAGAMEAGWELGEDFEVLRRPCRFDAHLLEAIQARLHECQEMELTATRAEDCIGWLRETRRVLREDDRQFHDGRAWLLVAEAIMVSSLTRAESRGFFYRCDFREEDQRLNGLLSCAWYDEATDAVSARLVPMEEFTSAAPNGFPSKQCALVHGTHV